jgi:cytochrome P450
MEDNGARSFPDLSGHPLFGHVPEFHRDKIELLRACAATPGPVARLRMGRPALVLKRAEDVHHVLVARHAAYPKGARNVGPRARRIFGTGLMTTTDVDHRQMRVRVQPAFRRDPVSRLDNVMLRSIDAMLDRWAERDEVDLADEMNHLAFETLIGAIFGDESGSASDAIEQGMVARRDSMGRAFVSPITQPGFLPIALRRGDRQAIRRLNDTIDALIRERAGRGVPSDDLLSMVIATRAGTDPATRVRAIRDETLNLVLAGHANIARVLTYTLDALASHADVEDRLREEVVGDREPTAADGSRLSYMEMTLAESMRLWPPSTLFFRVARQDDVLPSGVHVRAGWKLLLSPFVVQRDPAYYPDPERFHPERFTPEARRGRPKYAYFPFGGGPRVCIGQTLSSTICTLALTRMTQRARLEPAGERPAYACGCLPPGYGPRMRVRPLAGATTGERSPENGSQGSLALVESGAGRSPR